ncbi:unnamed protein product [Clonostachys byssicola]|uniref:Siderophore iron transporter 1 n=1 Tax=Clonostachys byssicola TaxID=160290 RepID=A0A9N9UNP2_9HYPO|nr:unnamed protein product [Clonostachys byssicola]
MASSSSTAAENAPLLGYTGGHKKPGSSSNDSYEEIPQDDALLRHTDAATTRSPGVARMALISSRLTTSQRVLLFASIFLVGYAYGLESQVRSAYQPYATASFNLHSYLATINVLRAVVAVAVQPTAAKIADVFGRFEVVVVSTVLYTVGITIESTASGVKTFCLGSIIYQVGYTCIVLLMEVLVADFSSMRARVFFSYIPAIPFIINTWISGNVTSAVLSVTTWRWGLGMWAIIYPIASLPLLITLYRIEHRAFDDEDGAYRQKRYDMIDVKHMLFQLFHQLDVIGLILIMVSFSLILAPLTITGERIDHWKDPHIIVPLTIGLFLAPVFILWEHKGARSPLVPFHLLTDRGVWAALAVRSLLNFAWYTQGNYLYTVLVVAFDFSVVTATRILSFFSFFGVVSGVLIGLVIYRLRRLKYIIVVGTCMFMVGFAVLIKFPGGASPSTQSGIISGQVLLGLAGGLFAYPTQASIQASATREHVAILTGLYLSFYNVGSALGTCLAGAIWTQTLLPTLTANLDFQQNKTLPEAIYDSPFGVIKHYPVGTEIRTAIIASYEHVQRLLCIAGIVVCVPMIAFALALRNPKLSEHQVQPEAEAAAAAERESESRRHASVEA